MKLSGLYTEGYYEQQVEESLRSARIVLRLLWNYLRPASVLDVGCGRGAWLKACKELGSSVLLGFDGNWNSHTMMVEDAIQFMSMDLNQPFLLNDKADLAMSLEVAEHLEPSSSSQFVECLTQASDAVLFGAAYTGQGGTNHQNERPHTYWARLFVARGYVPFDLFRPFLWTNKEVAYFYRQNTFLYCKEGSSSYDSLKAAGCSELVDVGFMDCIHPILYALKCRNEIGFKEHVRDIVPSLSRAVQRRIRRRHNPLDNPLPDETR